MSCFTGPRATQTRKCTTYSLKKYRNPVIYAQELHEEMVQDNLTRKQLGERHGLSSDRVTQRLCLLKLPEEKLKEIEALGDYCGRAGDYRTRVAVEQKIYLLIVYLQFLLLRMILTSIRQWRI